MPPLRGGSTARLDALHDVERNSRRRASWRERELKCSSRNSRGGRQGRERRYLLLRAGAAGPTGERSGGESWRKGQHIWRSVANKYGKASETKKNPIAFGFIQKAVPGDFPWISFIPFDTFVIQKADLTRLGTFVRLPACALDMCVHVWTCVCVGVRGYAVCI